MITGRVYMIVGSEHEQVYIGSTTYSLAQRFSQHKNKQNRSLSKELVNDKEVGIYLIEETKFEDRTALRWRERYWWEMYDTINKIKPVTSKEEKKDAIKLINKNNYYHNKDIEKERVKNWRKQNPDKVKESNKKRNPEKHRETSKKYKENNNKSISIQNKNRYNYQQSWGGDKRSNNNLLKIDLDIFK